MACAKFASPSLEPSVTTTSAGQMREATGRAHEGREGAGPMREARGGANEGTDGQFERLEMDSALGFLGIFYLAWMQ